MKERADQHMFNDRDKDIRNYRKAIYYDGIHRYEDGVKGQEKKLIGELTPRELDHICYKSSFSANKQLLSAIMPRLKEIEDKEKGLYNLIDQILEDWSLSAIRRCEEKARK